MNSWTSVNALYQIYPRSFFDTNDDGVGDLQGIIQKLDYLKGSKDSLGIDAIWISPFYPSPMKDFGYDVADYRGVDPIFGNLHDFKQLLEEAHARDIKVMIDYVPNHTSDQHEWFKESRSSRENPKRDYYVWRDPKPDGSPPNNWVSIFGGPAWTLDKKTGQYYLHSFLSSQPDLNWANPKVEQEMQDVLRYWLDMGVDGFRADAVWHLSRDEQMRDDPRWSSKGDGTQYWEYTHKYCKYGPHLFEYLSAMADVIASYDDRFIVYEHYPDPAHGESVAQYRSFYDVNPAVAAPFNFEGMYKKWGAADYEQYIRDFSEILSKDDLPIFCFSNHDQTRIVTRFGREQSRLIAMLQLTLPGMPTIYYGDEIGMEDGVILPEQAQDPSVGDNEMGGRDPERTPMQWTDGQNAGFSAHEPWLPVAESHKLYNVASELQKDDSHLVLYRELLRLRSETSIFTKGTIDIIHSKKSLNILAYERSGKEGTYRIILNFANAPRDVFVSYNAEVVLSTRPNHLPPITDHGELVLGPYEGVIVKLT